MVSFDLTMIYDSQWVYHGFINQRKKNWGGLDFTQIGGQIWFSGSLTATDFTLPVSSQNYVKSSLQSNSIMYLGRISIICIILYLVLVFFFLHHMTHVFIIHNVYLLCIRNQFMPYSCHFMGFFSCGESWNPPVIWILRIRSETKQLFFLNSALPHDISEC